MTILLLSLCLVVLAFALGSSLASFFGCVRDRRKTGESLNARSHCACGRQLKPTENIPVLGWLRTGGTAHCCGARLPAWMLLSEIALGMVFAIPVAFALFS